MIRVEVTRIVNPSGEEKVVARRRRVETPTEARNESLRDLQRKIALVDVSPMRDYFEGFVRAHLNK